MRSCKIPGLLGPAETLAIEAEWAGRKIRILDPVSLFACKLELAVTVSQEKRREVDHLRILVPCVRAFLREFLEPVERGDLPAKGWLGAANRVMKITSTPRARKAAVRFGINWAEIFSHDELGKCENKKIATVCRERLPRWKPAENFRSGKD